MSAPSDRPRVRSAEHYERALDARDPRFDGVFFVGIISTGIYCRPVCPARVSHPEHRRFFHSAAAAERSGFRPCLRCRPELAPGRSRVDAVSRLADAATRRIEAGALNGRTVPELADDLSVSARHLRRALRREVGVSPVELAQTHRLLLAKRLLTDTRLQVGRIAHAAGFQSVRRFNAVFREQYRMSPSDLRRGSRPGQARNGEAPDDTMRLTLAYRPPLAWTSLLRLLADDAVPGVEIANRGRYGRTVRIDGHGGFVYVSRGRGASNGNGAGATHLDIDVSVSLLPVLMPLLAELRHLFDLDAEPEAVDEHLCSGGLADRVARRPGLRLPGALDGFEVALRALLGNSARWRAGRSAVVRRVVAALGRPLATAAPGLDRLSPDAASVAETGTAGLIAVGVPRVRASALTEVARRVRSGDLVLRPGVDARKARRALLAIDGIGDRLATTIVMRALRWPDAFPFSDPALLAAAGASDRRALRRRAERWRPWRSYAALHLWLGR